MNKSKYLKKSFQYFIKLALKKYRYKTFKNFKDKSIRL